MWDDLIKIAGPYRLPKPKKKNKENYNRKERERDNVSFRQREVTGSSVRWEAPAFVKFKKNNWKDERFQRRSPGCEGLMVTVGASLGHSMLISVSWAPMTEMSADLH